jgi:hypothetical protein
VVGTPDTLTISSGARSDRVYLAKTQNVLREDVRLSLTKNIYGLAYYLFHLLKVQTVKEYCLSPEVTSSHLLPFFVHFGGFWSVQASTTIILILSGNKFGAYYSDSAK